MPKGNDTVPCGQDLSTHKKTKRNKDRSRRGEFITSPGIYCVCPKCGLRVPYQLGFPCYMQRCPRCGTAMTRTQAIFNDCISG